MSEGQPINAKDRKIGPIPLPLFLPLCIFTPSFRAVLGWFVYSHTVEKYKTEKQHARQDIKTQARSADDEDFRVGKDVQMQVRAFVDVELAQQ